MDKRIGIISLYYKNFNYGGLLQAYALTHYLNKNGYNAEQICWELDDNDSGLSEFAPPPSNIKNEIKMNLKKAIEAMLHSQFEKRNKKFLQFQNEIPHSNKVYSRENIASANEEYDIFITGSDQVWNFSWYNSELFLKFASSEKQKMSYAASMPNTKLSEKAEELLCNNLSDFSNISVRENSTAVYLNKLLNRSVECVLDPTLLLDKQDWDEISGERLVEEKYAFCYFLGGDVKMRKLAAKFAKENNLTLVTIPHAAGVCLFDTVFGEKKLYEVSPADFVSLIKHAEYVFTDSFHASVFSNIYAVKYFVFSRKGFSMDERINTLLQLFDESERFCVDERENIDYIMKLKDVPLNSKCDNYLEHKNYSINYLKHGLE